MVEQSPASSWYILPISTGPVRSGVLSTLALTYIACPDRRQRPGSYHVCMPPMLLADAHPIARNTRLSPRGIADSGIGDSAAAMQKSLAWSEHSHRV